MQEPTRFVSGMKGSSRILGMYVICTFQKQPELQTSAINRDVDLGVRDVNQRMSEQGMKNTLKGNGQFSRDEI